MSRKIVSVWFANLAIDRLARRMRTGWRDSVFPFEAEPPAPLAIITESGNRLFVTNVNHAGAEAGIAAGMMLADARAVCPGLVTRPGDPRAEGLFLRALARLCRRFTPLVAIDGSDGLLLDVTGCDHLFGGAAQLLSALSETLVPFTPSLRAALAPTPGGAIALARYGVTGQIVDMATMRDALSPLPVTALRLDAATSATLMRLGLERIGDLYPLATAALSRRFGAPLARRLRQALGADAEPVHFPRQRRRHDAVLTFGEPIFLMPQIEAAVAHLLKCLCRTLARSGLGCRQVTLTIGRVDASAWRLVIATANPARSAGHLMGLFRERLKGFEVEFGIERMHMEATHTGRLEGTPAAFAGLEGARPAGSSEAMTRLIDRLANRLGFDHVQTLTPADSHVPERAFLVHGARFADTPAPPWRTGPARPLRLLARPRPLYDFCLEHFSWNRRVRRIIAREGPERIEAEWWWDDPAWPTPTRDYWRIEDEHANRFWVYSTTTPRTGRRWYLHGVFA